MKKLLDKDLEKIEELHSIYSKEIPTFMKDFIEVKELQRLGDVGQNCGRDYINDNLQTFNYNYSRLNHSIGVGLIVYNFSKSEKQTIAGLYHDIATPTFAHVIDYYNNDSINQTSTEDKTEEIIKKSDDINKLLIKYNIDIKDISDYTVYPIADNPTPQLSADRLEYNFYMGTARNLLSMKEAEKIYDDIIIVKNEKDEDEMCFKNMESAKKFTEIALENGRYMSGDVSSITNSFLSDILKKAVQKGILKPDMFWDKSEEEVVHILDELKQGDVKELWKKFRTFDKVDSSKKRYVNPLVQIDEKIYRIADIDEQIKKEISNFLNEEEKYYNI